MRPTRPERTCLLIRAHKRACSAAYYPNPPQRRLRTFQVIPHSRENIKNIFLTPPRALLAALSTISALIAFRAQLALGTSPPLRSVDYCFAILPDSGRPGESDKRKETTDMVISSSFGATSRTRTGDLRITNALLYQLSQSGGEARSASLHIDESGCKSTAFF